MSHPARNLAKPIAPQGFLIVQCTAARRPGPVVVTANEVIPSASCDPYHGWMAFERITVDPERMGGVPCIRDLRVTVRMVLGRLASGRSVEEVLGEYPYLERDDVLAALEYAAAVVNEREVPVARPA
jgi:uncharacterized protein (DUF433 family)